MSRHSLREPKNYRTAGKLERLSHSVFLRIAAVGGFAVGLLALATSQLEEVNSGLTYEHAAATDANRATFDRKVIEAAVYAKMYGDPASEVWGIRPDGAAATQAMRESAATHAEIAETADTIGYGALGVAGTFTVLGMAGTVAGAWRQSRLAAENRRGARQTATWITINTRTGNGQSSKTPAHKSFSPSLYVSAAYYEHGFSRTTPLDSDDVVVLPPVTLGNGATQEFPIVPGRELVPA